MSSLPVDASASDNDALHGMRPAAAEIHVEEVGLLYRNAVVSQLAALVVAPALAATLWSVAQPVWVVAWLTISIVITAARLQLIAAYRRADPSAGKIVWWRNAFIAGVAASGMTWGAAALFMTPETGLGTQFVVIFTLAGMVAAAAPTQAAVPAAFYVFSALALTPLAAHFLAGTDETQATLGLLTILYMLGMSGIARRVHTSLRTTLELRHQNRTLIDVLTRANADAEEVNAKLRLEIAEHRLTERTLENSLSLLQATLESTNDGICVVNRAGQIVSHNQRLLDLWRLPTSAVSQGTVESILEAIRPKLCDPDRFVARTYELLNGEVAESHEIVELVDGRIFERFSMPQRIAGIPVGRVYSYRDVTERRRAEDDLQFIANHDALTQLPNRSLFARCLDGALARARRRDSKLSILFIDLDRFKNINDTLGHESGDRLLGEVAARLRHCLRETDTVARLGGDEFVVLAEDVHGSVPAVPLAQRILEALAQPHVLDGRECHVTASIGIANYPEDGSDTASLLKHADIAMYRAKEKGKNAFEFYTPQLNIHTVERLALEASLRHAIERDELVLHYQPKLDLATRRIVGVEALIRWQHPDLGFVPPGAFIPLAEETGLVVPIGEWVLRTACNQAQRWIAEGLAPLRVAVNISARQFVRDDLPLCIDQVLQATGMDADLLEIELTESMTMTHVDRAIEVMAALKLRRIHLAIDDFGTGYSSLGYLKRFPIDSVKIDRSFVRDLPHAPRDCGLAQAAIAMAHALGLRAVAEGVETEEQLAFLQHHGCDEVQGFYFARPMPAADIVGFVTAHEAAVAKQTRHSA